MDRWAAVNKQSPAVKQTLYPGGFTVRGRKLGARITKQECRGAFRQIYHIEANGQVAVGGYK